jgi:norsolorinic acid ketoreductase
VSVPFIFDASSSLTCLLGLGFGFVKEFLGRPNTTVIAAVRDPSHPSSQALSKLPVGPSSSLIVVKIDSSSKESAFAAIQGLEKNHGITSIDVVVANAAISNSHPKVADADLDAIQTHFIVNTIGVVALFQAVLPLLNKSEKQKKFIAISTGAASIGNMESRKVSNSATTFTSLVKC